MIHGSTRSIPAWAAFLSMVLLAEGWHPGVAAQQRHEGPTQPAPEAMPLAEVRVERPLGLLFLESGVLLVAAGDEGVIEIDPERWERTRTLVPGAPTRSVVALAPMPDGSFLALDERRPRLERFDPQGAEIPLAPQVASPLADYLCLRSPRAIAVTRDGTKLAIADTGNDRVLLMSLPPEDPDAGRGGGAPDTAPPAWQVVGGRGAERGRFRGPAGVAFDPAGRLFVTDSDNHRVQRLGRDGGVEVSFGTRGAMPGQLEWPLGISSSGDSLLVADHFNHRIQRLSEDGDFISLWGMHAVVPREGNGRIHYPVSIAEDPTRGRFAVAEPFERRVQIFRRSLEGERIPVQPPLPFRDGVSSHFGEGLAVDGTLLAAWEPESSAVVLFDLRGERPTHVATFGSPGRRVQEIGRIRAIEADEASGRVWIADAGNDRLVEWSLRRDPDAELRYDPFMARVSRAIGFEALGRAVAAIDGGPVAVEPAALARAPGELLLLDRLRGRAVRLAERTLEPTGVLLNADMGFPRDPIALAVDPRGSSVAILDASDPQRLAAIVPLAGTGDTRIVPRPPDLAHPQSIAWLDDDRVVVTTGDDRFFILSLEGRVLAAPSLHGVEDGRLWHPRGVRRGGDGGFFIVDWGNHRLQRFDRNGDWLSRFGIGRAALRPRMPDALPAVILPRRGESRPSPPPPATESGPFPRTLSGPDGSRLRWWPVDERGDALRKVPLRDPFFVRIAPPAWAVDDADAVISVDAAMPHHGHGMNLKPMTRHPLPGGERIAGPMLFHMPGAWELYIDIERDGRLSRWQDEIIMDEGP